MTEEWTWGLDTRRPPAWLGRIEVRTPTRVYCTVMGAIAVSVGAMISTALSQWLVLPGIVLAIGLLWFIATVTNQRRLLMFSHIFAAFGLAMMSLFLIQDRGLADRGRWVDAVVVDTSQTRSESKCVIRYADGQESEGPTGGCRNARPGQDIRLFADPEGEVPPSNTAPNTALWWGISAALTAVITTCAVRAAANGARTKREYQAREAREALAARPRYVPPPPPPPAAPPNGW